MPYVKDNDFARVMELIRLIKELAEKEKHRSIPDIAGRALKIIERYVAPAEPHSSVRSSTKEARPK